MDTTLPNTDLKGNLKPLASLPLHREQLKQLDPQLVLDKKGVGGDATPSSFTKTQAGSAF